MRPPMLTLYHLNISHFCEKARWALDYKKLEYRSRILTPGFHILTARRVAGTRTVPVLYDDETGTAVPESTDILHYLDRIRPDPPLFPVDADLASAVVEVEDICDQGWGPNSSSAAYCSMVEWPGELRRSWSQGLNAGQKALLALAMPVLVRAFRRVRGLTPEACAEFRAAAVASLDELEAILERNGGRYLVGDTFSAADLTGAALLAPMVRPPGSPWAADTAAEAPEGYPPEELEQFRSEVAARPIARWALRMWETHR
jgi:glutathione S-transferase